MLHRANEEAGPGPFPPVRHEQKGNPYMLGSPSNPGQPSDPPVTQLDLLLVLIAAAPSAPSPLTPWLWHGAVVVSVWAIVTQARPHGRDT